MQAYTKQTGDIPVCFAITRVTSEGNDTKIVIAIVGPVGVHIHAIAVSVTDIHQLAIRRQGRFASLHPDQGS